MKKSSSFVASVAAASVAAISSAPPPASNTSFQLSDQEVGSGKHRDETSSGSTDKFAPRFDGLRFIETLVTAHR